MSTQPRLAGGARPRRALAAAAAAGRARVTLIPPGGGDVLSLWATVDGATVVPEADAPEVAVGWAVAGRGGLAGTVTAVDGRTLTLGPTAPAAPESPAGPTPAAAPKPRRPRGEP